jgi:DNA repair exonuclease SbcCD nuclease subunit
LAHRTPTTRTDLVSGFHVDRGGVHIAVFHGSEQSQLAFAHELGGDDGSKDPYGPFRAEELIDAGIHHAFVGHIHTPRDHALFTYPGNPEPLTFGERGELTRGLVLARIDGSGLVERERVSVARIRISDVEIDLSGCASNSDVREAVAAELQLVEGFVRAKLYGEVGETVDLDLGELQTLRPQAVDAVVFQIGALHAAYPIVEIAQETNTVRGRFVNDVLKSDLDEHEKRRVITTGLRALDRRKDLAVV